MDGMGRKQAPTQRPVRTAHVAPQPNQQSRSSRRTPWVVVLVLAIVLVAAVIVWWFTLRPVSQVDKDKYQIVYMTTGQAYFGKLVSTSGDFFVLENVYVTQADDLPADATEAQKQAIEENTSLVKVTNQVYGPDDQMQLRASNVLFWQNLSEDSKVAQAIEDAQ